MTSSPKKSPGLLKSLILGAPTPSKAMESGKGKPPTAAGASSSSVKPNEEGGTNPPPPPPSKISWSYLVKEGVSPPSGGAKSVPQKRDREVSGSEISPERKKLDSKKSPKTTSAAKEAEENLEDDEAPNLTDQELADYLQKMGIEVVDPSSFADAVAAKQPRKEYPFLVYLQSTKVRRERITFKEYESFTEFFEEQFKLLPLEERSKVDIDWSDYHMGRGLFACCDEPTANFVQELADAFTFGEKVFKGWLKSEFGDRYTYYMWLPGVSWCNKSPGQAMALIFRTTNVVLGDWKVTKYEKNRQKKGAFCIFEADAKLASSLYYLTGLGHKKKTVAKIKIGPTGKTDIRFKLVKGGQDEQSDEQSTSEKQKVIMSRS